MLPIKHQTGVFVGRNQLGKCAECCDDLDVSGGVVVAKDFEDPVRGTEEEEGRVILVDELSAIDARTGGVGGREAGKEVVGLEIPYTVWEEC